MKLIGGLLIICASICASFFYEKKQRNIINNQEALIDFLSYISSQIEYFAECDYEGEIPITRPPQSWCYVESGVAAE